MDLEEIKKNAEVFAARLAPLENNKQENEQKKEELLARKEEIEQELVRMRKKRYTGTDDDVAEDIVEELYRELLQVEKQIKELSGI